MKYERIGFIACPLFSSGRKVYFSFSTIFIFPIKCTFCKVYFFTPLFYRFYPLFTSVSFHQPVSNSLTTLYNYQQFLRSNCRIGITFIMLCGGSRPLRPLPSLFPLPLFRRTFFILLQKFDKIYIRKRNTKGGNPQAANSFKCLLPHKA